MYSITVSFHDRKSRRARRKMFEGPTIERLLHDLQEYWITTLDHQNLPVTIRIAESVR